MFWPLAVISSIGMSDFACHDAEIADDGWGSGDFDAAKVLADGDRRQNSDDGDDHHKFDESEALFRGCLHSGFIRVFNDVALECFSALRLAIEVVKQNSIGFGDEHQGPVAISVATGRPCLAF